MRALPCLALVLATTACDDAIDDNVSGQLSRVEVTVVRDDCTPRRLAGDGGVQFFGVREDGGVVFTVGQQVLFGPMIDGGSLESVQRQLIPASDGGRALVGKEAACSGSFSAWQRGGASTLRIEQEFPGADVCPSGPVWLPQKSCTTERVFVFSPEAACESRCLRISAAGEVSCSC